MRDRLWSTAVWQRTLSFGGRAGGRVARLVPRSLWVRVAEHARRTGHLDYAHADIQMCVDSWVENDVRLHSCAKEPETIAWIESALKPGDVFFDIGANVGAYALVAYAHLGGNCAVYAFEPGFATFPQLCRNIALNRAEGAIVPLQLALSDAVTLAPFHYQNTLTGGALHSLGAAVNQFGRGFHPTVTLKTPAFRLDDLVAQLSLPWPNHIKIDVDGTERQVLEGACATIERPELRTLLIELSERGSDRHAIDAFLTGRGLSSGAPHGGNVLYTRAARLAPG